LEISKKNLFPSLKLISLKSSTNLRLCELPEILSPFSKIFFSPITTDYVYIINYKLTKEGNNEKKF